MYKNKLIFVATLCIITLFFYDQYFERKVFSDNVEQEVATVHFEIVIPSYNNEMWCIQNLRSAVDQDYPHFHITYIDDCSSDSTGKLVDAFIEQRQLYGRIAVIHNKERKGALYNLYHVINRLPDKVVVVTLDGDDFLAHKNVLQVIASLYAKNNIWLTYGQFKEWPTNKPGWCSPYPQKIIENNEFRAWPLLPSHLRTFKAWLFKRIKYQDLLQNDQKFYVMSWDQAFMFPMIEMAAERHLFIPEVLYLYNTSNAINDFRVNSGLQIQLASHIRIKDRYSRLNEMGSSLCNME